MSATVVYCKLQACSNREHDDALSDYTYLPKDQVEVFHQAVDALREILKKKYKLSDWWLWPDEEIKRKQDLLVSFLDQNRLSLACLFPDNYSVKTFPSADHDTKVAIIKQARKSIKQMEDDFQYNHFLVPGHKSETKKDPYNEAIKAVMFESTILAETIHRNRNFSMDWLPVVVAVEYIGSSLHTWYQKKGGSKSSQKSDGGVEDANKEPSLFESDGTQADPAAIVAGVNAAAPLQTGATPTVSSLATGGATGSDRVRDREEEDDQTDGAVVVGGGRGGYRLICGIGDLLADLLTCRASTKPAHVPTGKYNSVT
ncbi:expressed unknown protein [Seminavis robusta]|uniref:Uncharacterized protein n=1 Tax=Seminavis robusta TaxID=568900 RepID=A0A9N8DKV7_9STRA|nr:expressed unknown protein [Seminavis robusta]|eukprot:Sro136_g063960.1 n/a (314) ;mRNA; f:13462-14541